MHRIFENEIYNYTEFVDDILKQSENSKENTETPKLIIQIAPLERMIILEKLGIIKYIQSIQKDSKNEKKLQGFYHHLQELIQEQ